MGKKTHGLAKTRIFRIWRGMRSRCDNPNVIEYPRYGGAGITYQSSWKEFINFRDDMYESYLKHAAEYGEKDTTLERKDNSKGYTIENCTWATIREQNRNMKTNVIIEFDNKKMIMSDWAREYKIPIDTFKHRLSSGWDIEKALKTPIGLYIRKIEYNNEVMAISEAAKKYNLSYATLRNRLNMGMSIEEALLKPLRNKGKKDK